MEQREPTPDEILRNPQSQSLGDIVFDWLSSIKENLPLPLNAIVIIGLYLLFLFVSWHLIDIVFNWIGVGNWTLLIDYLLIPIPGIFLLLKSMNRYKASAGNKSSSTWFTGYFK